MEQILDIVVIATGLLAVGLFIWATRGHFTSKTMTPLAKAISMVVVADTVLLIWSGLAESQPLHLPIAGLALMVAGLLLFWGAIRASREARLRFAFDPEHPDSLVSTGPYKVVRHPFYVSYLLFWGGWSLASGTLLALPFFAVLLVLYWIAARMEEQKFSESPLAQDYAQYKSKVGFFWPKFG